MLSYLKKIQLHICLKHTYLTIYAMNCSTFGPNISQIMTNNLHHCKYKPGFIDEEFLTPQKICS